MFNFIGEVSLCVSIGGNKIVEEKFIGSYPVIGFMHSNTENGKWTKAQKRFVKIEGTSARYIGNKRFIKPIILTPKSSHTQLDSGNSEVQKPEGKDREDI